MKRDHSLDTTLWSCGQSSGSPDPQVEALIQGIARPERERLTPGVRIARGGMGEIEELFDNGLKRRVARKVLPAGRRSSVDHVRLFLREAQVTSHLEHPNIVPVHSIGDEDNRLHFTMKLVEGTTLTELIEELPPGALSRERLVALLDIVVKICDALALAHSRGIYHCDIKPDNVMVGGFGEVYLMDWGVARIDARASSNSPRNRPEWEFIDIEASSEVAGTLAYMSPEQALSEADRIGPHTDVFGVGATLYEAFSGRPPYHGLSYSLALSRASRGQHPPVEDVAAERKLPAALTDIVDKALMPEIENRYTSILELKGDLLAFLRGEVSFPTVSFRAGETIVREGEPGASAYIIEQGQCSVYKRVAGKRELVRRMGQGEVFGETAVLSPGPRTATVVADEDVEAQLVTADSLLDEVQAMRPWMGRIIRTLAERFRETQVPDQPAAGGAPDNAKACALQLLGQTSLYGQRKGNSLHATFDDFPTPTRQLLQEHTQALRQSLGVYPEICIDSEGLAVEIAHWRRLAERLRGQGS